MITWINGYNHQNGLPPVAGTFDARACGKADIEGVVSGAIGGLGGVCLGAAFAGPVGSGVNAVFQCF